MTRLMKSSMNPVHLDECIVTIRSSLIPEIQGPNMVAEAGPITGRKGSLGEEGNSPSLP